uniref:Secretory carrier-associated membrane protein n=2 Tax=Cacopsylla melanoneura TaxID=428564 RepID=A0A8D8WAJ2_9HEMI
MSGFDESPFGQPTIDNDPFADPAVQQVTRNSARQTIEDYNPFGDPPGSRPTTLVRGAANPPVFDGSATSSQPAILNPTQESVPPPNYARVAQQSVPPNASSSVSRTPEQLKAWEDNLARQAAELDRKERELQSRSSNVRMNNWPPLPDGFCFQPCFYQDIDVEIPVEFQRIVRHLYYLWMFHTGLMVVNIFGALLLMMHNGEIERVFMAVFFIVLLTPTSFLCWFRPAYKAFKDDSSFNFMVFFFIFLFQFLISLTQAIGTKGSGTCGILVALSTFNKSASGVIVGVVVLAIALGFCAAAACDILMLSRIHNIYRSSGASMAKAQAEFTTNVLRSEQMRDATSQIVQGAVRSQFEQQQAQAAAAAQQSQAPRF